MASSQGPARTTLVIGVVAARSGRLASLGDPLVFAAEHLRPALSGIRVGERARGVRLAVRDSRSEAEAARLAVRELVEDERADIIVTLAGTQVLPAVGDACEELGVPCVSSTFPWQVYYFGRGATASRPFTWTYHFCWGLGDIASVFADMWDVVGPGQRVGCLWNAGTQGTWSRDGEHGVPPTAARRGHQVVDPGGYEENTSDFGDHITAFLDADVSIVTSAATAADLALFRQQAAARGLRPALLTCSRWLTYPVGSPAIDPDAAGDVATLVYWSPHHPYRSSLGDLTAAQLAAGYERSTGKQWLQPLGLAYALFEVAVHALAGADDPTDRHAIAAALGRTRLDTMAGHLDWTTGPVPNVATVRLAGGQWQRGTRHPWELAIVTNTEWPELPVTAPLRLAL